MTNVLYKLKSKDNNIFLIILEKEAIDYFRFYITDDLDRVEIIRKGEKTVGTTTWEAAWNSEMKKYIFYFQISSRENLSNLEKIKYIAPLGVDPRGVIDDYLERVELKERLKHPLWKFVEGIKSFTEYD